MVWKSFLLQRKGSRGCWAGSAVRLNDAVFGLQIRLGMALFGCLTILSYLYMFPFIIDQKFILHVTITEVTTVSIGNRTAGIQFHGHGCEITNTLYVLMLRRICFVQKIYGKMSTCTTCAHKMYTKHMGRMKRFQCETHPKKWILISLSVTSLDMHFVRMSGHTTCLFPFIVL